MVTVKIVGSDEATVSIGRVPCVGETVITRGLPRKVIAVEHTPYDWEPPAWEALREAWRIGPIPCATITVADE